MTTMSDVARRAGVSRSTVSYTLSGIRPISDEVRDRVHAAMRDLDYSPNALARGLASRRSGIIAMLYPLLERGISLSGRDHIWAAADEARSAGYNMVLWTTAVDDIDGLGELVQQGLVEGVILMEVRHNDPRVAFLSDAGIPFSEIGRSGIEGIAPFVDTDFDQTAFDALAYLDELGHKTVVFVNHPRSTIDSGYGLAVNFQAAMETTAQTLGIELLSIACDTQFRAGYDAFSEVAAARPGISAVVSTNERALVGVMEAVRRLGLDVPRDLSVVAMLSSAETAESAIPALTTVSPAPYEMGRTAMASLLECLDSGVRAGAQTLVASQLTVRESTGPVPSRN
ncbi:MAG: transcriptional regulator, LacI family [Microbacteriaceae bacterium]|nr:transcriptional regulator, LacI family [Microbacteriaceae bacterium]